MTLFGKFLLLVNLLAGGAFVYLATQDWKGRQTITAVAVRHKLLLSGLPLEGPDTFDPEDETPFRLEMAGGVSTDTVSKKILELYFQLAPGGDGASSLGAAGVTGVVPCQLAEVKRVKAKIETILKEKADKPDEKLTLLKDWLIFQSETLDERVEVQTLFAGGKAEDLEKRLMAKFDAVIAAPKSTDLTSTSEPLPDLAKLTGELNALKAAKATETELGAKQKEVDEAQKQIDDRFAKIAESRASPLDEVERRVRIAHLLIHLSQDAAWQKRVMIVVGLRRYVGVLAAQAPRFRDMSARLERLLVTDQVGYLSQEADQNKLARARTELAARQSKLKEEKVEQKIKEDDFVEVRLTQLKAIKVQLEKMKAEVDETLVKQTEIETGLFEVQREVAITLDEVYKLEAELEAKERELLKLAKKPNAP